MEPMQITLSDGTVRNEYYEEMIAREKRDKRNRKLKVKRDEGRVLTKSKNESILYIQRLPDGLKAELKDRAYVQRLSLNAYIIKVLQEFIEKI